MAEQIALKFVYFLYSIEKDKNRVIISHLKLFQPEIIKTINKIDEKNIDFNINLYKITIDCKKLKRDETSIKIRLIDKDNSKFLYEYSIDITDKRQNIFLYDIDFRISNSFLAIFLSTFQLQYNLSIDEKYEIFRTMIKNDVKDNEEISKRKLEDLIYYTQKKLEKEKFYNFSFFVSLLIDINIEKINNIEKHFELFNINRIIFDDKKNSFHLDTNKILFYLSHIVKNKLNENKMNHDLLYILLLLYKFDQYSIKKLFFDKFVNNCLYKILLADKKKADKEKLFPDLKLSCTIINDFIEIANDYNDILLIISFNDDFLESLEIININFEFITEKIKMEKEKIEKIKFDDFVIPKIKDDLKAIKKQIENLVTIEKQFNKIYLVEISSKFFEKYYTFHEKNIDQLICLFQILKIFALNKGIYKYSSISRKVFIKLRNYAEENKLINMNLLLFIETMPAKERHFNEKILKNIDMDTINDEFIKKFKEFDWEKLLNITKDNLIIQMCSLIKNIENFGKIFLLFDFNKDINKTQMNLIKDTFIGLSEDSNEKEYSNKIDVCSKLIYFLNVKNCELKPFFNDYFFNIFYNMADKVFSNIYSKYEYDSLNNELKRIIFDFYNKLDNKDLDKTKYLIYEIENNENFNSNNLDKYYINYEDFFDLNKTEKFDFLESIISKNLLNKKCLLEYRKNSKSQAKEIINNLKNGIVKYKQIKKFFNNKNDRNEFKKRIEIISKFIHKYEENKLLYDKIEKKINDINKIKEDLNIIQQKMNIYFKKPKKEEIKEIQDLIIEIETYNLDYYLMNQDQIQKFLEQKEIQALPLNFEKSNFFFKIIFDEEKRKTEDELEIIKATKTKLNNFTNILNSNSFNYEYIKYINKIMNELNEEQYKNLNGEIENLMHLNKGYSDIEIEKKVNILKNIWKKDLIYNFSIVFKYILITKENKKTEFTSINNLICKYLESPKNLNIIKLCFQFCKNYEIELNEDKYFEFFKSIKLIQNIDEIANFLFNIKAEQIQIKLNKFDGNTLNDDYNCIKDIFEKLVKFKLFIDNISSYSKKDIIKDIDIIKNFLDELDDSEEIRNVFITIIYNYNLIKDEIKIINL